MFAPCPGLPSAAWWKFRGRQLRGSHLRRASEYVPESRREGARRRWRDGCGDGQGPVGLLLMMLARLAGATVLTSDPMPERRAVSERFGAAAAAILLDEAWMPRFARAPKAAAPTLSWSPCRSLRRSPKPLALARPGGRVLLFAQNDPQLEDRISRRGRRRRGKRDSGQLQRRRRPAGGVRAAGLFADLPVAGLITHRFPLEEFEQALVPGRAPQGGSLKVVITP